MTKNDNKMTVEEKIIFLFEKINSIQRISLWDIAKVEKLSPIQIQFLIYIKKHKKEVCTIKNIAQEFGLTLATVSDAVKTLISKGLINKIQTESDKRISNLELTSLGMEVVDRISNWADKLKEQISNFPDETKETVLIFLMELVKSLLELGIINVAKMCVTCKNFQKNRFKKSSKPHYCNFTKTALGNTDLNFDCPGNIPINKK